MSPTDTKVEQIPVETPLVPEPEKPEAEISDPALALKEFERRILTDIKNLKTIEDNAKREATRLAILTTLANKELEWKSLRETVGFKKELADLFVSTIDELRQKVEDDRKPEANQTWEWIKDK